MDKRPNELDNDIEKIDLKNTSKNTLSQKTAKKIVKRYRNLKRKAQLLNYSKLKKSKDDDIVFIKQVLVHPRDRLKKLAATEEKVEFMKQVPVYPRDRLKKLTSEKVEFIKQVPVHPRDRLKKLTSEKVEFMKQVPVYPKDGLKKATEQQGKHLEVE